MLSTTMISAISTPPPPRGAARYSAKVINERWSIELKDPPMNSRMEKYSTVAENEQGMGERGLIMVYGW